jgi:hypothetical protein
MADGEGFEPPGRSHARWFSRPVHSTALPPIREGAGLARLGQYCKSLRAKTHLEAQYFAFL